MKLLRPRMLVLATAVALLLAGCGASPETPDVTPAGTPPPESPGATSGPLVGIVAIGHSGLTGEGTRARGEPALENSWATGTSPEVDSVYTRLVAVRPENEGHVANRATGGARSASLVGQARSALEAVPHPELVIISTIDNDIQCDGKEAQHVEVFGQNVDQALDVITAASPDSTILIVGQLGRPSVSFVQTLVAHDPSARAGLTGTDECSFFTPDGQLVEKNFDTLTGIIQSYEDEEARVCAQHPHCHTDGGVRAAYVDVIENFSNDWNHFNVQGQAAEAELIWPVVASYLGLTP